MRQEAITYQIELSSRDKSLGEWKSSYETKLSEEAELKGKISNQQMEIGSYEQRVRVL